MSGCGAGFPACLGPGRLESLHKLSSCSDQFLNDSCCQADRLKDLRRVGGSVCNSDEVQWRDPHLPDDAMRIVDSV